MAVAKWKSSKAPKAPKDPIVGQQGLSGVFFWNSNGIIFVDYLEHAKIIYNEYYSALLDWLDVEKKVRPKNFQSSIITVMLAIPVEFPEISGSVFYILILFYILFIKCIWRGFPSF